MRAVSSLVATLLLIVIVVGVGVAVAVAVSKLTLKSAPRTLQLVVAGGSAVLHDSTLVVRLYVTPVGSEPAVVDGVRVLGGVAYDSLRVYTANPLKPGATYELTLVLGNARVEANRIHILIHWRGVETGTEGATHYQVKLHTQT